MLVSDIHGQAGRAMVKTLIEGQPISASADGTTELSLSPLELIDQIAALVPPPRVHRHRYHGVLAPNSPLHANVTALAGGKRGRYPF